MYPPSEASLAGTDSVLTVSEGARLTEETRPFIPEAAYIVGKSHESSANHTPQMAAFDKLGLSRWLARQLEAVGFREPTPVQQHCIPPILEGELGRCTSQTVARRPHSPGHHDMITASDVC